jgi:hypothetical protein
VTAWTRLLRAKAEVNRIGSPVGDMLESFATLLVHLPA